MSGTPGSNIGTAGSNIRTAGSNIRTAGPNIRTAVSNDRLGLKMTTRCLERPVQMMERSVLMIGSGSIPTLFTVPRIAGLIAQWPLIIDQACNEQSPSSSMVYIAPTDYSSRCLIMLVHASVPDEAYLAVGRMRQSLCTCECDVEIETCLEVRIGRFV